MTPATSFKNWRVALFGLGGSGLATLRSLVAGGADVTAFDDAPASVAKAAAEGLPTGDLREIEFEQFDSLVLAPGVPLTHPKPHWTVEKAKAANVEIIGDIEVFCRERRTRAFDAPFVAITGTNGKSTTTALVAHVLREAGWNVQMGGNIGVAVLDLEPPAKDRVHVIECSSYQIDLAPSIDASVGVLLNVSEDHLERHGTINRYAAIKKKLIRQASLEVVIADDPFTRNIAYSRASFSGVTLDQASLDGEHFQDGHDGEKPFDPRHANAVGVGTTIYEWKDHDGSSDRLTLDDLIAVADLSSARALRGRHNMQNALAAWLTAKLLKCPQDAIVRGFATFPGLAHRMEEIPTSDGIVWINDSKATNADSAEKALASFDKVFWILGGKPKTGGIEALAPFFGRVNRAYLIGEAAEAFAETLGRHDVPWAIYGTVERAVEAVAKDAAGALEGGPVVLFSPACASFDQFKNFEERGEAFRRAVLGRSGRSD